MKRTFLATAILLLFGGSANAGETRWMSSVAARPYAEKHLAKGSNKVVTGIKCRKNGKGIDVKFVFRGGQPIKWQYAISDNPLADLKKVNAGYKKLTSVSKAGGLTCGLAHRQ